MRAGGAAPAGVDVDAGAQAEKVRSDAELAAHMSGQSGSGASGSTHEMQRWMD